MCLLVKMRIFVSGLLRICFCGSAYSVSRVGRPLNYDQVSPGKASRTSELPSLLIRFRLLN